MKQFKSDINKAEFSAEVDPKPMIFAALKKLALNPGPFVALDWRGEEAWRFDPGDATPFDHRKFPREVTEFLVEDLLSGGKKEILTISNSDWFPCRVCILDADGDVLEEMWHPGSLIGCIWFEETRRLVFWGCNNDLTKTHPPAAGAGYVYVIFCIDADRLSGQCPPHHAPGLLAAPVRWYKIIRPVDCLVQRVEKKRMGVSEMPAIEIVTRQSWWLYLDQDGQVIGRAQGDGCRAPEPLVEDVAMDSR